VFLPINYLATDTDFFEPGCAGTLTILQQLEKDFGTRTEP